MTYRFADEGTIAGVRYVTVLDEGGNPVEYNVEYVRAHREYGQWWRDDEAFPQEDWREEVADGDTLLGYHEWVLVQREAAEEYAAAVGDAQ